MSHVYELPRPSINQRIQLSGDKVYFFVFFVSFSGLSVVIHRPTTIEPNTEIGSALSPEGVARASAVSSPSPIFPSRIRNARQKSSRPAKLCRSSYGIRRRAVAPQDHRLVITAAPTPLEIRFGEGQSKTEKDVEKNGSLFANHQTPDGYMLFINFFVKYKPKSSPLFRIANLAIHRLFNEFSMKIRL